MSEAPTGQNLVLVPDDVAAEPVVALESITERRSRDSLMRRLLAAVDGVAILVALVLMANWSNADRMPLVLYGALTLPLWTLLFKLYGLYDRDQKRVSHGTFDDLPWLFHALLVGSILLWGYFELLPQIDVHFQDVLKFGAASLVLVTAGRALVREGAHMLLPPEQVLFLGSGDAAEALARKMRTHPEYGLEPIGTLDDDSRQGIGDDVPRLGPLDDLRPVLQQKRVDRIVLSAHAIENERLLELARVAQEVDVKLSILPGMHDVLGPSVEVDSVEGLAVLGIHPVMLSRSSRALKRGIDVLLSGLGLLITLPLTTLIAIVIKMESRGPVFFHQRRIGLSGTTFRIVKFRTMVADAEAQRAALVTASKDPNWLHLEHDPRITRVGRFLRRSSLDELPQLWNVLKGEMSLVGPRPLIEEEDRLVEGWQRRRLDLVPGITGMWQVLGRTNIPFEEMVKLDYLYVTNWSLWSDLKILTQTLPVVVRRRGVN
jgi:exopolysaccharide biosynthesis polyprenyl glycosylphosphotransferase